MSVSAINNSSSTSSVTDGMTTNTRTPKHELDSGDFMKLLAVQMQNQDPMSPMDNNQQMAQMAQMSSVQSMTQMMQGVTEMSERQSQTLATSYLGLQVTLLNDQGDPVTGQVTAVDATTSTPKLQIGDSYYPISSVTRVEFPKATPTP